VSLDVVGEDDRGMYAQEITLDERDRRLAALERALAGLPDDQRRILTMKYQERHTCAEIAARLRMKTNTVAKALSRAYERLEQVLTGGETREP
jgi:RNA polymerase sigma factor (sigma-70 family)